MFCSPHLSVRGNYTDFTEKLNYFIEMVEKKCSGFALKGACMDVEPRGFE